MYEHIKEDYLKLEKGNDGYTFRQLQLLRDMAKHDVYPDWRFSDEECNVWAMFR